MKKILSLILCMAMLLSAVCAFASCKDDKKKGDDINYDIDLSQKPNLSILMPNSGKSVDAVNCLFANQTLESIVLCGVCCSFPAL